MPRICVVGAGAWGKNHVRTLKELGYLGGLVEVDSDLRGSFVANLPGLPAFASLGDAIAAGFDGFTVATPAETHYPVAKEILESGFPVLVEKPLALDSIDATDLVRTAEKYGHQIMVGHLMLFHPAVVTIKKLIDNGKIGRVQYIYSNRVNLGTVRTEENILWSFAPHDVSIFQYFLGSDPIEVTSSGAAFVQPHIHDTTMTTFKYPNNVMCHNYVSWLHPFKEHRIVVIGSKGMLSFDDVEGGELLFHAKGIDWVNGEPIVRDGNTEEIRFDGEMPLAAELRYFAENLSTGIDRATGWSGVRVLEILERATKHLDRDRGTDTVASGNIDPTSTLGAGSFVHESSYIDGRVRIGPDTMIWHYSHVQSGAQIGRNCSVGQNVNVGKNARIGNNVKIQNNVSVFEGVELEDFVFCGPSVTFTNVLGPRSRFPQTSESYSATLVQEGATIGANATIVCGNTIGRHALIAAGAVVTSDVPKYGLMIGVPARRIGWVTEGGDRIPEGHAGVWTCSVSGTKYDVTPEGPVELSSPAK